MKIANGAQLFLETLLDEGIRCIFGNPGTTELPLMDALVDERRLDYYLCLQEAVAIGAAEGYAFATGGVGVVNLHVAPGLGNAMGMLYNSKRAATPLVVTAGNQGQPGQFHEIVLWDDLARMAAPLTKWAYEVRRVEDLEQAVRRAIKVALTPPTGPVFLSFPGDVQFAPAGEVQGLPTRISTKFPAAAESIGRAAAILAGAERPLIVAGAEVTRSGGEGELVALAEQLGAKVCGETFPSTIAFPLEHPLYAGELTRIAAPLRRELEGADVIFLAGTEAFILSFPPDVRAIPEGARVVQMGLNSWEIGKNFPAEAALFGDPKLTLATLVREVEAAQGAPGRDRAARRRAEVEAEVREARARQMPKVAAGDGAGGMSRPAFQAALGEALPKGVDVVDESLTTGGPGFRRAIAPKVGRIFGMKGGGIGMGLPTAVGVKAASPERPVVCVSGDGSAMYTFQSLWTAARYGLGALFVIANNRSYRILKERVLRLDGKSRELHRFVAMDFREPPLDFSRLAGGLGVRAIRAETPEALKDAVSEGLSSGAPCLVDAVLEDEEL